MKRGAGVRWIAAVVFRHRNGGQWSHEEVCRTAREARRVVQNYQWTEQERRGMWRQGYRLLHWRVRKYVAVV